MNWILNIIGIVIFFIVRYECRSSESKPSWRFWLKDNWREVATSILFNTACMIILIHPETSVDINIELKETLPAVITVAGKLGLSFALGLGLSFVLYEMYKKKIKKLHL